MELFHRSLAAIVRLRMIKAKQRIEKNFHCLCSALIYTFYLIIDWGRSLSVLLVQKKIQKKVYEEQKNEPRSICARNWNFSSSSRSFSCAFQLKYKTVSIFCNFSLISKCIFTKVEHDRDNVKDFTYPAFSDATIDMWLWGSLVSCRGERPERGTSGAIFCSVFVDKPAT